MDTAYALEVEIETDFWNWTIFNIPLQLSSNFDQYIPYMHVLTI